MHARSQFLGGLTPAQFLSRHWQKAPLLVRNALPDYVPPLSPEELAGLACEKEVESRVVTFDGTTWHLENGPFAPATFPRRSKRDWTLLVQDLDEHIPEIAALLKHIDFLPSWRVDDIMASFAVPGGSVGPHYDEYDVFLLQVSGRRRWQISTRYSREDLRTDSKLKLLTKLTPEQEWVVGPGDLLYLPPHVAHFGVAETNCVTFSLGCRAPSRSDLVAQMAGLFLSELDDAHRYGDRDLTAKEASLGVSGAACARTKGFLDEVWQVTPELAARCLGTVATVPKLLFRQDAEPATQRAITRQMNTRRGLFRRKGSRWTWYSDKKHYLFVDGREYSAPLRSGAKEFLRTLCETKHFAPTWLSELSAPQRELVQQLVRDGQLSTTR